MSDDPDSGHPTPRDPDDEPYAPETPKRRGNHRPPLFQTSTPCNPGSQPRVEQYFQGLDETSDAGRLSMASRVRSDTTGQIRVLIREEKKQHEREKKKAEETRMLNESMRDDFEAKKRELEDLLNATVAEKEELQEEVKSTKQKVTSIQFDIQAKNLDLEAAERAISTKDALVLAKEEELAAVREDKAELVKKLDACNAELEHKERDVIALRKELEDCTTKYAAHIASLEKRNNQNLANGLEARQKLQTELSEQNAKHSKEKEELVNQLTAVRETLDGERSDLEKRLHEEIRTLREGKELLQSSLAEAQQKERESLQYSKQLEAQLATAKQEVTAKDKQLEEARVALENGKSASSVDLQRLADRHRTEVTALTKEVQEWEQKCAHEEKIWEASEEQLRASLERADRETEQLQKALTEYRSELAAVRTLSTEKETQLRTLQDHIEQLQTERDELSRERSTLYSKVTAHSKEELKLRNELEEALVERANHLGKIAELSAEVDRFSEEAGRVSQIEKDCLLEKAKIEEEREKIRLKEADFRKLIDQNEAVQRELAQAGERMKKVTAELAASVKAREATEKEMERLGRKNEELSSMNDAFAQRQLDESTVSEQLRSQFSALQRKHEKLAEKHQSAARKLENADEKVATLEEDLRAANDQASRKEELEKINTQLTKEIEYLRAEVKSRPKAAEFRELAAQLDAKEAEREAQEKKINEIQTELEDMRRAASRLENLQGELRHKEELLDGFKDQIESYRRDQDEKHWKLAEAHAEKAALVEEFRNYQAMKEGEISHYTEHVQALENEVATLRAENRPDPLHFDLEKASVWDAIPHSLRPQIPQEIETVLRALRVDRSDANSLADSQVAVSLAPGLDKIIAALEEFYRLRLTPADNTYNIIQQVARLLDSVKSAMPDSLNGIVERFSADVQQILETKDKKWQAKIEHLQNDVEDQERERQTLKKEKHEEEMARTEAENKARRLRLDLEGLRKSNGFQIEEKDRFKREAERLSRELTALRHQSDELRDELDKMKTVALNAISDIKALGAENDAAHELEMDLRGRLRDAEAEREEVKRAAIDLERELADTKISVEEETTRRIDAERRVEEMKARLVHEEKTKRVNQGIMWKCMSYLDRWSEYAERLKRRNYQRQRILDRIHNTLKSMEQRRREELWQVLDMPNTTTRSEQWKRDDEMDGNGVDILRQEVSAITNDPKTDMVRDVLAERSGISSRRSESKENRRPK